MIFGTQTVTIENRGVAKIEPIVIEQKMECIERVGNLPQRNNNPLNITYGGSTRVWVEKGLADVNTTKDGRKFLKFCRPEHGWEAGRQLLKEVYSDLSPESAMRKFSNGGYGAKSDKKISEMTEIEFNEFVNDIAKREGYFSKI